MNAASGQWLPLLTASAFWHTMSLAAQILRLFLQLFGVLHLPAQRSCLGFLPPSLHGLWISWPVRSMLATTR